MATAGDRSWAFWTLKVNTSYHKQKVDFPLGVHSYVGEHIVTQLSSKKIVRSCFQVFQSIL